VHDGKVRISNDAFMVYTTTSIAVIGCIQRASAQCTAIAIIITQFIHLYFSP